METKQKNIQIDKQSAKQIAAIIVGLLLFALIMFIVVYGDYYLSEQLIKEKNCDVCLSSYELPQCQTVACEPVVNAFKF